MHEGTSLLTVIALAFAAFAAALLLFHLIRRPPLTRATKLWLLLGLGPLPITAAMAGNVANLEVTKERKFCGSCHVMEPYIADAASSKSTSLAAIHSRNPWFGQQSCYTCHADYGMFGLVTTKIGGMHHVWDYYTKDWDGPGSRKPALYKPYPNNTCMQCHTTERMQAPLEHRVHAAAVARGEIKCAGAGCHGPPHPTQGPAASAPQPHAAGEAP
jgi:cytochrome c-type protein NapC